MYSPSIQFQHIRDDQHMKAPPSVVYAQLKYIWANGAQEESLNFLRDFSGNVARDLQSETKEHSQRTSVGKQKLDELARLLARCYFKQGQWQLELKEDWGAVSISLLFDIVINPPMAAQCQGHSVLLPPGHPL